METIDRTQIIGGSDIAAVMGLNRFKTPLALWAEKTGKIQTELSNFEAAEIGVELEEYVARKFEKKTGIKLRRKFRTFEHPVYPYMVGHIDRLCLDGKSIFEAKTTSAWNAKEWVGEEIPQEYILQIMWYLGLSQRQRGYIAVLIGGQKFRWKEIAFDPKLFEKMVESACHFREEFIQRDIPPMAQFGDSETLLKMFPESVEKTISFEGQEAEEFNALVEERSVRLKVIDDSKKDLETIEAKIKQRFGENEAAETDAYRVTWKTQTRAEYFAKASQFRVLRTKKKEA